MRSKLDTADATVAEIAARQHGVISTRQLAAAGLTRAGIARRTKLGRLHALHRGVYAVGHPAVSMHGRWMAAVLACGRPRADEHLDSVLAYSGAALSHRSAAILWRLLPSPNSGIVEISAPTKNGRARRRGIRLHRCSSLLPSAVTRHQGIPVTTPARTIADLRHSASPRDLRAAIRQADVLGLPVEAGRGPDRTRSELERRFLRLCRRSNLPTPEVNVRIESLLVDFLWRDRRLIVETDGYRYHRGRAAFEDDRDRDLRLKALGYEVIRLSYRQIEKEPGQVAEVLSGLLGAGGEP